MIALDISGLTCRYEQSDILSKLDLQIEDGEIVCLLGRSGCGKTTLLKAISGLLTPSQGQVALHGNVMSSAEGMVPPEHRGIGMIFQDYALFPHLTVHDNIAFGLQKLSTAERKARVQEMLELVNLQGLDNRYPHELSVASNNVLLLLERWQTNLPCCYWMNLFQISTVRFVSD